MTGTNTQQLIIDALYTIAGILFCGFALKGFLVPNQFFDGGVTGISLLTADKYRIIKWLNQV